MLDSGVEDVLHFRAARIGDDAAISERARAPLGASLKPAENFPGGNFLRSFPSNHLFGMLRYFHALFAQAAGGNRRAHLLGRITGPPIGVLHDERTRLAEDLVMDVIGGSDGKSRHRPTQVGGKSFERSLIKDFPVRDAIEGHAARKAHRFLFGPGMQTPQHLEQDFLEARLQRRSAVAMNFFDRSRRITGRPQALGHEVGIHGAEFGSLSGVAPGHVRARDVMLEIFETQAETDVSMSSHDAAKFIEISRLAVSGQAHHLVLIAKFFKAEVLRDRGVIQAERVRECNRAGDIHPIAPARSPHGAGEIAQPVRREKRGLLEWRDKKCAGQMGLVVLDAMISRANLLRRDVEGLRQGLGNPHETW